MKFMANIHWDHWLIGVAWHGTEMRRLTNECMIILYFGPFCVGVHWGEGWKHDSQCEQIHGE